jgi:hypothetical protein
MCKGADAMSKETDTIESKPEFACERYPKCPDRLEVVKVSSEFDEETNSLSTSSEVEECTGPCEDRCFFREMEKPVDHSVFLIGNGFVIDIGL